MTQRKSEENTLLLGLIRVLVVQLDQSNLELCDGADSWRANALSRYMSDCSENAILEFGCNRETSLYCDSEQLTLYWYSSETSQRIVSSVKHDGKKTLQNLKT